MVNLTINGRLVSVSDKTTIIDAAKTIGISIPTLCFLEGIHDIAACRVCVVEVAGVDKLVTACNTYCTDGMEVSTNSMKVRNARRTNIELLLSQHHTNCPICARNGNCQLQSVASLINLDDRLQYVSEYPQSYCDRDFPIIRNESKCIRCYRCVSVCDKIQSIGVWDMVGSGSHTTVGVRGGRKIAESDCTACGQCITHCPVNALHERNDAKDLMSLHGALSDPTKIVVAQIAPAVRAAWGEEFCLDATYANEHRMVDALKKIGFDYIFDTNFSADLTIMEEGMEFLHRFKDHDDNSWPMFTSCCPGWVRFLKSQYPDMVDHLSTAKSPQQMFGAITKSYFAHIIDRSPEDIICVSIMPCTAKKAELKIPNINDAADGCLDVDYSITTREMCRMIKASQIDVHMLEEKPFDSPLGIASGAGVIFGATGGVMEAALRTCSYILNKKNPDPDAFKAVRSEDGDIRSIDFEIAPGITVHTAIASGLANARKLIRAIRRGEVHYDFVEIMACPGGCAGGGGQPIHYNEELAAKRSKVLYQYDKDNPIRYSHDNPEIQKLYKDYLKEPCSKIAHHLLHTDHHGWEMPPAYLCDSDVMI